MRIAIALILMVTIFVAACNPPVTGGAVGTGECSSLNGPARDNCYLEQKTCSKIKDTDVRDSCVADLASAKKDLAACNLIKSEKTKSYCQQQVARATGVAKTCDLIKDEYWKDNCNYHLGVDNNNHEACSQISTGDQKSQCYKKVAIATNNHELCPLAEGQSGSCYFLIARETKDLRLCDNIPHPINKDACRIKVVKLKNDPLLCVNVQFEKIRSDCYDYFKEQNN